MQLSENKPTELDSILQMPKLQKAKNLYLHQPTSFASGHPTIVQEALPRAGKAEYF